MFAWLNRLDALFPIRYAAWLLCGVGFVVSAVAWARYGMDAWLALLFLALVGLGVRDTRQTRHSVLRNYPVIGHLRFLLEFIRPEMRQYFIEGDNEAAPFSRQQRSLVYQRAKGDPDKRPFGTQMDVGRGRLRVDQPLDAADRDRHARLSRADRRRPRAAVQRQRLQHLGDELRRAQRQRDPRAQRRRQARRLRARHRRRRRQPLSPRERRRPHLGDRLRLFRLPQRRRQLQRRALRRERDRSAGQDGRAQDQPGRQARPRRRAAGPEGHARDRRGARRPAVGRLHLAGERTARSRRRSR